MYIQHSLSYAVRNFHLNWLTFLEAITDVLGIHFSSGHSVEQSGHIFRWNLLPPTTEEVNAIARDVCLSVCLLARFLKKRVHGFQWHLRLNGVIF